MPLPNVDGSTRYVSWKRDIDRYAMAVQASGDRDCDAMVGANHESRRRILLLLVQSQT